MKIPQQKIIWEWDTTALRNERGLFGQKKYGAWRNTITGEVREKVSLSDACVSPSYPTYGEIACGRNEDNSENDFDDMLVNDTFDDFD